VSSIIRNAGRLRLLLVAAALGAACLLLPACGDEEAVGEPTVTAAPAEEAVQPSPGPAEDREWSFRGQRGITAAFAPADLALYRSLLPAPFEMPEEPLVAVSVVYYYDVTAPLTPYREGYVVLQCRYQGRTGWCVLTMPVDDETADAGGRFLGFPKYVADRIELEEADGVWSGRVIYQGRTVMALTFTPEAGREPVTTSSAVGGPSIFLLVPPAEGPQVNEIGFDLAVEQRTVTTSGSTTVEVDPGEPWAGLLPPGDGAHWGTLEEKTGDWILVATQP